MRDNSSKIIDLCLLAGKITLANGGETYRVEDTMVRIAKSYLFKDVHSFVTPTGIFLTVQGQYGEEGQTKFIRITERSINLNKVMLVNDISRKISEGKLSLEQAYERLKDIEQSPPIYPIWLQVLASAIASGFFTLMFGGEWYDFFPSFVTGGLGFSTFLYIHRLVKVKFFGEIISSFLIGIFAYLFLSIDIGVNLDKIIIGSVMPLVPGVAITNAVRDLMAGDLVSGLARGAEAFLTALALGTGIAVVIALL